MFFTFLFIGIGKSVEAAGLGALLAGLALKNVLPEKTREFIESEVKTMAFGFFAPIFFLWVGIATDVHYLIKFPLLILAVIAITKSTKILSGYFMGRKLLGTKKSILLGISLSVKFSTSIIIIKLLLDKGLIKSDLYSVLIGSTIAFTFIVPIVLSFLIKYWKLGFSKAKNK